jgi:hypothetical protein
VRNRPPLRLVQLQPALRQRPHLEQSRTHGPNFIPALSEDKAKSMATLPTAMSPTPPRPNSAFFAVFS